MQKERIAYLDLQEKFTKVPLTAASIQARNLLIESQQCILMNNVSVKS